MKSKALLRCADQSPSHVRSSSLHPAFLLPACAVVHAILFTGVGGKQAHTVREWSKGSGSDSGLKRLGPGWGCSSVHETLGVRPCAELAAHVQNLII